MGAVISYIKKSCTYLSNLWLALLGKPVAKDPYSVMNKVVREATKGKAVEKAAPTSAPAVKERDQCTHCRGTGFNKEDHRCPHCKGTGQKPKPQSAAKSRDGDSGSVTSEKKKKDAQGYKGKSEFYIEGYEKMSKEEKKAAKQALWDRKHAAKKSATPQRDGFSSNGVSGDWGNEIFPDTNPETDVEEEERVFEALHNQ